MKVLFDLNVLLDLLLDRAPWSEDAKALTARVLAGEIHGVVSAISIPTLYYIIRRASGSDIALLAIDRLLQAFDIAPVGQADLRHALQMSGPDFEDNIQIAAAVAIAADVILTRDASGFARSVVRVRAPHELVAELGV
jgi:predicted nucleic acid-binding protein